MRHEMINMRYEPTTSTLVLMSKDGSIKVRHLAVRAHAMAHLATSPCSRAAALHQILDPSPVLQSSATFLSSEEAHRLAKVRPAVEWPEARHFPSPAMVLRG